MTKVIEKYKYNKRWRRKNKPKVRLYYETRYLNFRNFLNEQKEKACFDCKKKYPIECMQFDHVRGQKLYNIGTMMNKSFVALKKEMKKCDLLCSNCHAVRTKRRKKKEQWSRNATNNALFRKI